MRFCFGIVIMTAIASQRFTYYSIASNRVTPEYRACFAAAVAECLKRYKTLQRLQYVFQVLTTCHPLILLKTLTSLAFSFTTAEAWFSLGLIPENTISDDAFFVFRRFCIIISDANSTFFIYQNINLDLA